MKKIRTVATSLLLIAAAFATTPARTVESAGQVLAGAAKVDSTWHVGASAGQYASQDCATKEIGVPEEACVGNSVGDHGVDPFTHQTRRNPSYGIQGRESVRALVVQGGDGQRLAVVSNDLYIPQDLLNRRVAGILADHDRKVDLGLVAGPRTGITPENLTVSVSHSHSSPYYSSPSWGLWLFQDVFDLRHFEHLAQKMAQAVITASGRLTPVRVGAAAVPFTLLKKHSFGPAIANDGTPAGYPRNDVDRDLAVVRFDDVSGAQPKPLATWVVWGMHPENLDGNDLLASEYVNTTYRILDREIGGITLFSQNDTGTSEAHDTNAQQAVTGTGAHPPSARQEFSHKEYNQVERAARTLSDAVKGAHADVQALSDGASIPDGHRGVPFETHIPVKVKDLRFAPPSSRMYPTVSSCKTEEYFNGNPGIPILGLPDCDYRLGALSQALSPLDPGVTYRTLKEAGVPIPDNIGAPSYTGLEETLQVHLQAIRLGKIGITVCPCEQWADQSRNIKTRLDKTSDNLWFGWDWTANYKDADWEPGVIYDGKPGHGPLTLNDWCLQNADTTWSCRNPGNPATRLAPVSNAFFMRMKAQIYNDAKDWDLPEHSLQAESEPAEVDKIWGNFTHEELTDFGYDLVITVGMSNDYWGYIASYREFQRGDHYRKALTGLGPHSSDFLATRLSRMAAELNGGPSVELAPKDLAYTWDYQHQGGRQEVLGQSAQSYLPLYEATRPRDGGTPGIISQPSGIKRFDAAKIRWVGGSNFSDTPHAKVERCSDPCAGEQDWHLYADGSGEVEVRANYPKLEDMPLYTAGQFQWVWDATFEAFDSDITLPDAQGVRRNQTPAGTYRFVIEGCHRGDPGAPNVALPDPACGSYDPTGRVKPYRLTSTPFNVGAWNGISVPAIRLESNNSVSFDVAPVYPYPFSTSNTGKGPIDYPNTYSSPFTKFIHDRLDVVGSEADVVSGGKGREEDDDVRQYGSADPTQWEVFCFQCSFRPWADTGGVSVATVSVERRGKSGKIERFPATYNAVTGRWVSPVALKIGDRAWVDRGGVVDSFGEFNTAPSAIVVRTR